MIITIDTDKLAQTLVEGATDEWSLKQFDEDNVPEWSGSLIDAMPDNLEGVVWEACRKLYAKKIADFRVELVRRFAVKDLQDHDLANSLEWLDQGLEQVTTAKAFELAEKGVDVFQVYADGTDSTLDDLESEGEYYPDKTKNYPEIETIFVIENKKEAL